MSVKAEEKPTATKESQFKGPRNHKFARRVVFSPVPNHFHGMDLIDLSSRGAGYILVVVDLYSRMVSTVKIPSKAQAHIEAGLKTCWTKMKGVPKFIWADKEGGLTANLSKKFLDEYKVKVYHTNNSYIGPGSHANPISERMNRTIKDFQEKQPGNFKQKSASVVKKFDDQYNNRVHSTTKITPKEAHFNPDAKVERRPEPPAEIRSRYKVGDTVLLQRKQEVIEKKYNRTYDGPYIIEEIRKTRPLTYVLKDEKGLTLPGSYYGPQIKKYRP